jgi:hypothetical protein
MMDQDGQVLRANPKFSALISEKQKRDGMVTLTTIDASGMVIFHQITFQLR